MKYLSSSKGWKNKSFPASGDVNWPPETVISVYCFLIWMVVFVTSILSTYGWSTGVKKVLSSISNDGDLRVKSFTASADWSSIPPLHTPLTVGIPTILIESPLTDTPVIRLNLGTVSPGIV